MVKYQHIAEAIEMKITKNEPYYMGKLPVVETLMATYEVSKSTIIKSLDILEEKGLIYQVRGSGIYVRKPKRQSGYLKYPQHVLNEVNSDTDRVLETVKLTIQQPNRETAHLLELSDTDEIYYLERIHSIDGEVICIEKSYYNKKHVTYLNYEITTGSIIDYIKKAYGYQSIHFETYLNVDVLSNLEAKILGLNENDPKINVNVMYYLPNYNPLGLKDLTYHYKRSTFHFQTTSG
ncbi:GntR family transcriptional regulator [Alkalicoccobacillus gibsonii]|uniref:GntR family transcriptional regulator n=1 Tax=Alkalicoccobacillus gibsonii TaxID=79881 RepID=UPI0019343DE0|nr:GntR family transcriptional regulator [Alkalicoccobacillus gibsonii]MBM0066345.1 GntR family transcriptional regulator [Alkalicoccobacillus gibsonii]